MYSNSRIYTITGNIYKPAKLTTIGYFRRGVPPYSLK